MVSAEPFVDAGGKGDRWFGLCLTFQMVWGVAGCSGHVEDQVVTIRKAV